MSDDKMILIGIIELQEAKRLKSRLAERDVALELVANPETCSSGKCKPTSVEVYVREEDSHVVKTFLTEERNRLLAGLGAGSSSEEEVFDEQKETANCPACGTEFSTKLSECPDCGLGFAVTE